VSALRSLSERLVPSSQAAHTKPLVVEPCLASRRRRSMMPRCARDEHWCYSCCSSCVEWLTRVRVPAHHTAVLLP
jgi:hypothetical protein